MYTKRAAPRQFRLLLLIDVDLSGQADDVRSQGDPPASNVKAGGEIRLRQATAILGLTLFAALAISAATASGFEI
jgi:hypothetical protein